MFVDVQVESTGERIFLAAREIAKIRAVTIWTENGNVTRTEATLHGGEAIVLHCQPATFAAGCASAETAGVVLVN